MSVRAAVYKKKTLLEHVLLRAETYVGSKEAETHNVYVPQIDADGKKAHMECRDLNFVPAFYKIFDEIIVNAADNRQRDVDMDTIKVTIDADKGEISVYNNGRGIPVVIHEEEKIYVPEMIFGHLLTGSNYDDDEARVTGGRNGYGAKLTNIYSTVFAVETHDSIEGKTYKQRWGNNMTSCFPPKITASGKKGDYTKITFKPDLTKLNMERIDDDTMSILKKRVYDLTGSLTGVKVFLNGERIRIASFKDYVSTYLTNESEEKPKIVYEKLSDRWEVAVALSDSGAFQQVSFVNSIATVKGGTHVTYVVDQLVAYVKGIIEKKHSGLVVKPAQIRNQLFVFVNCLVENPTFDGQIKETMTLKRDKFGSTCSLPETFLKKVIKLGIVESTMELIHEKDASKLKKTDGTKRSRLTGLIKLHDANNAGTKKSKDCTLFLVEGESALTFALTGIPVVRQGRDLYGAFPLRGKLLNVREATAKQKLENKEIAQLKQILGLQEGKTYTSIDSLRYGHICILTDADEDGKHIKGLILNWLESSFPSLLKIPGFVLDFKTPIAKCVRGRETLLFYTKRDYDDWKDLNDNGQGWEVTYFKGLGTSEEKDIQTYFSSIHRHLKRFRELSSDDSEHLDLVFSKKRASDRKSWLQKYDRRNRLDDAADVIPISDFIDKDFITFSMYDNERSIPSVVDGLKPGQRKIIFTAIKNKMKNKTKIAQFAGDVAKLTQYHHGEQSLAETITGLTQSFVGANNVALLEPRGQLGTRRKGGKDAAAPRYTFTNLAQITRKIFHPDDDPVLEYLSEEGQNIEPNYYVPVIPMVLVNGAEGIGTGYSTSVLNYDPSTIVDVLWQKTLDDSKPFPSLLTPWYKGYTGTVTACHVAEEHEGKEGTVNQWTFTGVARRKNATTLEIVELPIQMWTENYKEFLEERVAKGEIKDYKEYHTNNTVNFTVQASAEVLDELLASDSFYKDFKLTTTKRTSNMMLFSPSGTLRHYANVGEILQDFYRVRMEYYVKRKEFLLQHLAEKLKWAKNRRRFISQVVEGTMEIAKRNKKAIVIDMSSRKYDTKDGSYDYLLNMSLHNLTTEKMDELEKEVAMLQSQITVVEKTSKEEMYRADLAALKEHLARDEIVDVNHECNVTESKPAMRKKRST